MVATGLPISTTASTTASTSSAESVAAPEDAGGFLGVLAQMLIVAPAPVVTSSPAVGTTTTSAAIETDDEAVSASGMLPTALLPPLLNTVAATKTTSNDTGALQSVAVEGSVIHNGGGMSLVSKLIGELLPTGGGSEATLDLPAVDGSKFPGIPDLTSSAPAPAPQSASLMNLVSEPGLPAKSETPVASVHVQAQVGTQAWSDEVGTRLQWMIDKGHTSAAVRLNPEHLGPLEVQINVQDDQASVWFGAANAETRTAIENAMPRLRELLASQGLSLAQSGVFHEAPRQQGHGSSGVTSGSHGMSQASHDPESSVAVERQRLGLVDTYA